MDQEKMKRTLETKLGRRLIDVANRLMNSPNRRTHNILNQLHEFGEKIEDILIKKDPAGYDRQEYNKIQLALGEITYPLHDKDTREFYIKNPQLLKNRGESLLRIS